MADLKPYWFLEGTIDLEYKYYILMSYLVRVKDSFKEKDFGKNFKDLITMRRDLESFIKDTGFSQKTMSRMTDEEKDIFLNLLDEKFDDIEEIESIVKNSIEVIQNFIEENKELYELYDSLVGVESYCSKYNLWDQGFLVVRRFAEEKMRIFTWFFSIIKISQKESVALLMTEILDPRCDTTEDLKKIRKFLKSNINDFSESHDCIIISDVSDEIDIDTGVELSKEKSIDIIMNKFKS